MGTSGHGIRDPWIEKVHPDLLGLLWCGFWLEISSHSGFIFLYFYIFIFYILYSYIGDISLLHCLGSLGSVWVYFGVMLSSVQTHQLLSSYVVSHFIIISVFTHYFFSCEWWDPLLPLHHASYAGGEILYSHLAAPQGYACSMSYPSSCTPPWEVCLHHGLPSLHSTFF